MGDGGRGGTCYLFGHRPVGLHRTKYAHGGRRQRFAAVQLQPLAPRINAARLFPRAGVARAERGEGGREREGGGWDAPPERDQYMRYVALLIVGRARGAGGFSPRGWTPSCVGALVHTQFYSTRCAR